MNSRVPNGQFDRIREASLANSRALNVGLYEQSKPDDVFIQRPHYRLDAGRAYFLISRRPHAVLTESEQAVWNAIDGKQSVSSLRKKFGDGVDATLNRLVGLRMCERVQAEFPPRRRVLVIEPHMDDAVLSVGGTMWLRRNECQFIIVTAAGISNFTTYYFQDRDFFDPEVISAIRKAESTLLAKHLGGEHLTLDLLEAPLRFKGGQWTGEWFRKNRAFVHAFIWHAPSVEEHEHWTTAIESAIQETKADEIWMPLGVGKHVDHQLTRDACIQVMMANPSLFKRTRLKFYQDVPYAAKHPNHTQQLVEALRASGAHLEEECADISQVLSAKLHLCSLYACQLKIEVFRSRIEECSTQAGAGRYRHAELFFHVSAVPDQPVSSVSCHADRALIQDIAHCLDQWCVLAETSKVVRFLVTTPIGRWRDDMQALLNAFPDSRLEMHLAKSHLAETAEFHSSGVKIRCISPRLRWWCADLLRTIIFTWKSPVVIVAGGYFEKAQPLRRLLGSRGLIVQDLSHFILALQLRRSEELKRPSREQARFNPAIKCELS